MKDEKIFKSAIDGTFELCGEMIDAEEIITAGNSFFDRSYFGTRILILAPSPSDEILIAGNMLVNFAAAKAEIFIAYLSRKNFNASILKNLVKKDKIIFLRDKRDLKKIILELRANIIFCADFDSQVEYKNLSLEFEEVLGEILREEKNYRPEVYKKFACSTALHSPPDFYAPNLLSTRHPKIGVTDDYNFDLIDRANYSWENRIRFPVSENCRKSLLKNNPLSIAIAAYKNFRNDLNALRILNSDEVFFERRTDNLAYLAKVTEEKVHDFKILDAAKADKIIFDWAEGVQVQQIVIYGNFLDDETAKLEINLELDNFRAKIDKEGISLDNTCRIEKILPSHGKPLIIDTEKIFVRRAEIKVLEGGKNFGIGEVEFFSNVEPLRKIQPFIKLTTGKDFFYTLMLPVEVEKIPIGLYRFHVDEPVKVYAEVGGENILTEILTDDELILNLDSAEEIILTAEVVGNPNIYDRAIIRRVGDMAQIQFKIWQWLDKLRFLT